MPARRRPATMLCALLLAACYEPDGPTPTAPVRLDAAASPVVQSVTGSGHLVNAAGFWRRLTVTARRHEDGTVDGEWEFVAGATILHGDVTCLTIVGDEARVGGTTEIALFTNVEPGWEFATRIVDNGQGSADSPDQTNRAFFTSTAGAAENFCATGETPFPALNESIAGNFQIHR